MLARTWQCVKELVGFVCASGLAKQGVVPVRQLNQEQSLGRVPGDYGRVCRTWTPSMAMAAWGSLGQEPACLDEELGGMRAATGELVATPVAKGRTEAKVESGSHCTTFPMYVNISKSGA